MEVPRLGTVNVHASLLPKHRGSAPINWSIIQGEKVQVVNKNNGERLETYVIKGERNSGVICLNGAAARKAMPGDVLIIISYALMDFEEAKTFEPWVIFPDTATNLLK